MINSVDRESTNQRHDSIVAQSEYRNTEEWEREYHQSLALFDFSRPLPEKKDGHI